MKDLLAPGSLETLARLARSRTLLAFDFDGTLAPIVARRERAAMRPSTARLFEALCTRYPCAVLSGRHSLDVRARLGDSKVRFVVGNHGLEPGKKLSGHWRAMREVMHELAPLEAIDGVELEDKGYSVSVHFRGARSKTRVRRRIVAAIEALAWPCRPVLGKDVVNVVSAKAPHKGDALRLLQRRTAAETVLYVGDDVTDEDVFRARRLKRLVSVRVGRSAASAASYFLSKQEEIDRLLAWLLVLRENRTDVDPPECLDAGPERA